MIDFLLSIENILINEFTEFLSFYPTNRRADYAQYKLGIAHFRQMRSPQRDQTETRDALREFRNVMDNAHVDAYVLRRSSLGERVPLVSNSTPPLSY